MDKVRKHWYYRHLGLLMAVLMVFQSIGFFSSGFAEAADTVPEVISYKVLAADKYYNTDLSNYHGESGEVYPVGVLVRFSENMDRTTIDPSTTFAKMNMVGDGNDGKFDYAEALTDVNGKVTKPSDDELLFVFPYNAEHVYTDGNRGLHLVDMLELTVNNVAISDFPDAPMPGYEFYFDEYEPEIDSLRITSTKEPYNYKEQLKVELILKEEVVVGGEGIDDFFELVIEDFNGKSYRLNTTTAPAIGFVTDRFELTFEIDDPMIMDYQGEIFLGYHSSEYAESDDFPLKDHAGNSVYFAKKSLGSVDIQSKFPKFVEITGYDDIRVYIDDTVTVGEEIEGDGTTRVGYVTENWKVGVCIVTQQVANPEELTYEPYDLLYKDSNDKDSSHLLYVTGARQMRLEIMTESSIFDVTNDKEQNWQVYFYVQDPEGNINYGLDEDHYINRIESTFIAETNTLIPDTEQAFDFHIDHYSGGDLTFTIMALNDLNDRNAYIYRDEIDDVEYGYHENDEGEYIENGPRDLGYMTVKYGIGTINIKEMIGKKDQYDLISDTYVLQVDMLNQGTGIESTSDVFVTFDVDEPMVDIEVNRGGENTITFFSVEVYDINGHEDDKLISEHHLVYDDQVTLYYSFEAYAVSGNYPSTNQNETVLALDDVGRNTIHTINVPDNLSPGDYVLNTSVVDMAGHEVQKVSEVFQVKPLREPIECISFNGESFTQDALLNLQYELDDMADDIEYRLFLDEADPAKWTGSWSTLFPEVTGIGTLSYNFDENLVEGIHTVYFQNRVPAGDDYVLSHVSDHSFVYDHTDPESTVTYSTDKVSDDPVVATITATDNLTASGNLMMTLDDGSVVSDSQVTLIDNQVRTVTIADEAGNTTLQQVQANILANVKPAEARYSTKEPTNLDVAVQVTVEGMADKDVLADLVEQSTQSDGSVQYEVINNPTIVSVTTVADVRTFMLKQDGTYLFRYSDDKGRTGYINAYINGIDKVQPTGSVTYTPGVLTNGSVNGFVEVSEEVDFTIVMNGKTVKEGSVVKGDSLAYKFSENAIVSVTIEDPAGNSNNYTMTVDWIDQTAPVVELSFNDAYYETETDGPIVMTISANEPIEIISIDGSDTVTYEENTEGTVLVKDEAGNYTSVDVEITNIVSEPITITKTYSTLALTKEDVEVKVQFSIPVTIVNNGGSDVMTFTSNGERKLIYKDARGRQYNYFVTVDNIDKEAPVLWVNGVSPKTLYVEKGGVLNLVKGVEIIDNIDGGISNYQVTDLVDLNTPGTYSAIYSFKDQAGNSAVITRTVEVIPAYTLLTLINGVRPDEDTFFINGDQFTIDVIGSIGDYEVQYKKGYLGIGGFKKNKQLVTDGNVNITGSGYYTVFVETQERLYELIKCYVFK